MACCALPNTPSSASPHVSITGTRGALAVSCGGVLTWQRHAYGVEGEVCNGEIALLLVRARTALSARGRKSLGGGNRPAKPRAHLDDAFQIRCDRREAA